MTLKWKTDWVLGCYSTAGLEVGSVSSRLRLQDLQIKGKAEKGKSMCAEALYLWICSQAHGIILSMERIMRELQTMYGSSDFSRQSSSMWLLLCCALLPLGFRNKWRWCHCRPGVSARLPVLRLFSLSPTAPLVVLNRFV